MRQRDEAVDHSEGIEATRSVATTIGSGTVAKQQRLFKEQQWSRAKWQPTGVDANKADAISKLTL